MAETIKGLNIKLGLDTSELDSKLKSINNELKEEQKDLRVINNALKFDSSNLDKWKEKQDKLNSILENTKKRLEVQNARLEEAKKALQVGAISQEQFNQIQRSVQYVETDITKLNNELKNTSEQIKKLGGINTDSLKKVGSSFTKYVTAPILAASAALTALTIKSMKTADEIATNADKVYLTVEAYQEWIHVAKTLNINTTDLQKAFVRTNSILGDISQSGNKYNETLSKLGITSDEIANLSTDEAFELIRNSLSNVENQVERTALANEIFGEKLGTELSRVLQSTSTEINDLRIQTRELGIVTTKEAETAGKFTNSLTNLKQSFSTLGVTIGVQVVPVLQKVVDNIQNKLIPAIRSLISWWEQLSERTRRIVLILVSVAASIGPVITVMLKLLPIIKTLKSLIMGNKLLSFFQTFGMGKIAIIGIVTALVTMLMQSEKFRDALSKIFEAICAVIQSIGELFSTLISRLQPAITAIISVLEKVADIVVMLIEGIIPAFIMIVDILVNVLNMVGEILIKLINNVLPVVILLINEIIKIIESLEPIIKVVIEVIATIIEQATKLLQVILEPVMSILDVLVEIIAIVIDAVGSLITTILEPLSSVLVIIAEVIGVVASVLVVIIDILMAVLAPILKVIFAILEPLLSLLMVFIQIIGAIMNLLMPLIDLILAPLIVQLDFIAYIFKVLSPLIRMVGDLLGNVLAPVLSTIFMLLEPILWVLDKIIGAFKWIADNVKGIFDGIGGALKGISGFFGGIFGGNKSQNNSNDTTNNNTTNNVTVNTTASSFDVNSIDKALGGIY